MFEHATLTNGPDSKRAWTTFLGLTSQAALVTCAALAPTVWPQVLPTAHFLETLSPPLPPAPKPLGELRKQPNRVTAVRAPGRTGFFVEPRQIPRGPILLIEDEPIGSAVVGVPAGFSGPDVGVPGGMPWDLGNTVRVAPPRVAEPVIKAAPAPLPVIPRYTVGGNVRLGALLHLDYAQRLNRHCPSEA